MSSRVQGITPKKNSSIYEVSDYISLPLSREYVLVRQYRTGRLAGGHLVNEPVASTEDLLERMIRAFQGRCLRQPGTLRGIFSDSQQARDCAEAVIAHHRKAVEVVGKDLFIAL